MPDSQHGPQAANPGGVRPVAIRTLRALAARHEPVTVADLVPDLGDHPNSVRLHLDALVSDGLAERVSTEPTGRGRPAKRYAATLHGRQLAHQDSELDDVHALIEATVDHIAENARAAETAQALGRRWGERLRERSGSDRDVVATLAAQGFTPETDGDRILIRTCPFLGEARRRPELICTLHQGLLDAMVEGTTLEPFAAPAACVVTIHPAQPDDGA